MTQRSFYAQRQKVIQYKTIEIQDPSFDGGRLLYVDGQTNPVPLRTAAGEILLFQPATFEVKIPNVGDESSQSAMDVQLGSVGMDVRRKVKAYLKARESSNSMTNTPVIYRCFTNGVETESITRWLDNVNFEENVAAFRSSDADISNKRVADIYTAQRFPGLKKT